MTNTIKAMWNGSLEPCDQCSTQDPEINHLVCLIERNQKALCGKITQEQRKLLKKYIDCWEEYLLRLTEQAFCDGF